MCRRNGFEKLEPRQHLSSIAIFHDPAFVDTTSAGTNAEARNVRDQITSAGHRVITISGTSYPAFQSALAGADLLVVPELETGSLLPQLSQETRTLIRDFVSAGGGYLNVGDASSRNLSLLSTLFAYPQFTPWYARSPTTRWDVFAVGTAFEGGPSQLAENASSTDFGGSPGGAKWIYTSPFGSNDFTTKVGLFPYAGRHPVGYLGWDWWNGGPAGSLDGGWNDVLNRAIVATARAQPAQKPTGLKAVAKSNASVSLSWNDQSTDEIGFRIEISSSAGGNWDVIGNVGSNATSYNVGGLKPNTAYSFRVRSRSATSVSSPSAKAAAVTHFASGFASPLPLVISTDASYPNRFLSPSYERSEGRMHLGTDLPAADGTSVFAVAEGNVISVAGAQPNAGVLILHDSVSGPFIAVYGHIRSSLTLGARVSAGQELGVVDTPEGGAHLHFGIIVGKELPPFTGSFGWGRVKRDYYQTNRAVLDRFQSPVDFIRGISSLPAAPSRLSFSRVDNRQVDLVFRD